MMGTLSSSFFDYVRNIYFGKNSICQIDPKEGKPNKVDTIDDFIAVMYALFIDAADDKYLFTHYVYKRGRRPVVIPFNPKTFQGRVLVLYELLNKLDMDRGGLKEFIDKVSELILSGRKGEAIRMLYEFARKTGTLDLLEYVRRKIRQAKSRGVMIKSHV